jgi:O-antigen/teichoic acid export membrane protein
MERLTFTGFLLRLVAAFVLVFATFNPTGKSYAHWVRDGWENPTPLMALAGLVLLTGWVVFGRSTQRAIGVLGTLLAAAFVAAVVWLVASWGWLDPANSTAITWIVLAALAVILAVGLSWSHLRRRLTGQADVDEVDSH